MMNLIGSQTTNMTATSHKRLSSSWKAQTRSKFASTSSIVAPSTWALAQHERRTWRSTGSSIGFSSSKTLSAGFRPYPQLTPISRVEYGRRSQWTGNAVAAHASDPMQIRIWIDDKSFHVISTNTWETQVVHRIKVQIDEVIAQLNKTDVQIEREETQAKMGNFGMPDY